VALAEQILAIVNELLPTQDLLLKAGTAVDAPLIAAPTSSTKNKDRKRDPEMHSSQKGNEWRFGMKAHTGIDADSGLVHTVIGTSGNVADVVEGNSLLHVEEKDGFGDAGNQGERNVAHSDASGQAQRAGQREQPRRRAHRPSGEKIKASIRAKAERPFRAIKRQFGDLKVRYRGLKKNTLQLKTLFALSNLRMVRHQLLAAQA